MSRTHFDPVCATEQMTETTLSPVALFWSCPIDILLQLSVESDSNGNYDMAYRQPRGAFIKQLFQMS